MFRSGTLPATSASPELTPDELNKNWEAPGESSPGRTKRKIADRRGVLQFRSLLEDHFLHGSKESEKPFTRGKDDSVKEGGLVRVSEKVEAPVPSCLRTGSKKAGTGEIAY